MRMSKKNRATSGFAVRSETVSPERLFWQEARD